MLQALLVWRSKAYRGLLILTFLYLYLFLTNFSFLILAYFTFFRLFSSLLRCLFLLVQRFHPFGNLDTLITLRCGLFYGTLGDDSNISISRYLVYCSLFTDTSSASTTFFGLYHLFELFVLIYYIS